MIAASTGAQGTCLSTTRGWLGEVTSVTLGRGDKRRTKTSLGDLKQPHSATRPHKSSFSFIYLFELQGNFKLLRLLPSLPGQWELLLWVVLSHCSSWSRRCWPHSLPGERDSFTWAVFVITEVTASLKSQLFHLFKWNDGRLGNERSHIPKVLGKGFPAAASLEISPCVF